MNEQAWPSRRDPRPGEQALIVQLAHICDRNLARVRYDEYNSLWTRDSLVVSSNINVSQERYKGEENRAADDIRRQDCTYTWDCKCGKTVTRRHHQISRIWEQELSRLSPADNRARRRVVRRFVLEA